MAYNTLADFHTNRDQFLQSQPKTSMDLFDSAWMQGESPQYANDFQQNIANEKAWGATLSPSDLAKYQGLVEQDLNSGFSGTMRKYVKPLVRVAAMAPLAIGTAGAAGLLEGTALGGAAGFSGGAGAGAAGAALPAFDTGVGGLFGSQAAIDGSLAAAGGGIAAPSVTGASLGAGGAGAGLGSLWDTGAGGLFGSEQSVGTALDSAGWFPESAYTPNTSAFNFGAPPVSGSSGVQDFFKNLTNQVKEKPMSSILSGAKAVSSLGDLWSTYQQNQDFSNLAGNMMGLFGDDSAYARQLRKELQRRDAAAGRRSQYGPRSVELQAKLAELASRQSGTLANIYQQQGMNRDNMVKGGLNLLKGTGAMDWLDDKLKAPLAALFGG